MSRKTSEEVPDYQPFVIGGYDLRYRFPARRGDVKRSDLETGPREGGARILENPLHWRGQEEEKN